MLVQKLNSQGQEEAGLVQQEDVATPLKPYLHEQTTASAVWTVNHNLGRVPAGVNILVNNKYVLTGYECPDLDTVIVRFASIRTGKVEVF